jgi:signal transduction histidine kinase
MARTGITGKLIFGLACILIALGLAVTVYSVFQLGKLLREQMNERVEAQALNWIEANYTKLDTTGEERTLHQSLGELKRQSAIAYVILLDSRGARRAAVGVPKGLLNPARPPGTTGSRWWANTVDAGGRRYFDLSVSIPRTGTGMGGDLEAMFALALEARDARKASPEPPLGHLRIGVDRQAFEKRLNVFVRSNVLLSAFLVVLAVGATFVFARRLALQLEAANRKLEQRDRTRLQFLSTVSHELRTPLTSIKLHAEILLDTPNPTREQREHRLDIINESTDRLTRLVVDMLDLRRIDENAMMWKFSEIDLRELVRKAVELLAPSAAAKGSNLKAENLEEVRATVDADQIQRVITNLVDNALKFSPAGSDVKVTLGRTSNSGPVDRRKGEHALIRVADNGPGIPAEERDQVFEPFVRSKRVPAVAQGTGLGLTISRSIVRHHQGEIWIESQEGAGSIFCFTVPLERRSDDFPAHARPRRKRKVKL